jgi:hypothetical protein
LFDLSSRPDLSSLDPFAGGFRFEVEAARLGHALNDEFAKPIAPYTPERDYAPTQVVAEMIASNGFDGIRYRSAMHVTGCNYVFFRPAYFDVAWKETVRVNGLAIAHETYEPDWRARVMPLFMPPDAPN